MSIPIRSMSASRFSTELNWMRVRSACSRLTWRGRSLANWGRGCQSMLRPALLTISSACTVKRWQWMSTGNHFPRACAGPGKRPGICAPSGRHVNSILSFSPGLSPNSSGRLRRVAGDDNAPHVKGSTDQTQCGAMRNLIEAGKARIPWASLMQGVDWVYDRAVAGLPGLDGAEELAAGHRLRRATADAAIAALIREQTGKAGLA